MSLSEVLRPGAAATLVSKREASSDDAATFFERCSLSMRFTRYPKGEAYQITSRKLAAARRAVQREKDRYPLFPQLVKHQTAENRLASIAVEQEPCWHEMREPHARLMGHAPHNSHSSPPG